jgi:hypothetical protein
LKCTARAMRAVEVVVRARSIVDSPDHAQDFRRRAPSARARVVSGLVPRVIAAGACGRREDARNQSYVERFVAGRHSASRPRRRPRCHGFQRLVDTAALQRIVSTSSTTSAEPRDPKRRAGELPPRRELHIERSPNKYLLTVSRRRPTVRCWRHRVQEN